MYLHITGYSNGSFRRSDADFTSGGQCDGGLKMIIVIGEFEFLGDKKGGGNPLHSPGPLN